MGRDDSRYQSASAGDAVTTAAPREDAASALVDSKDLLGGRPQIAIRHGDAVYILRETRHGKLILTK